ncbi:hypothetical protein RCC89_02040 [Cytophagaceae bacterium ABcell3]|nr:hypothetical protein RCC89_02040 [Cytophagaceae bacterium ABcell3]
MCGQLQELITNDWHQQHAEIARIFQFKITCVNSIEPILESIKKQYSYLFDQDDFYPYVEKCVNAIRVIGNDKAKEALDALMRTSPDLEVRRLAKNQLTKFEDK